MIDIIDAFEARRIADDTKIELYNEELETIMKDIKEKSAAGLYHVTYENANFSRPTLSLIKNLCYKINYGRHYNDEYIEINWR